MPETRRTSKRVSATASDAYIFAYPLVLNEIIAQECAPAFFNRFLELRDDELERSIASDARIASLVAWLDVTREPVIVSFPATERYHYISFTDAWANTLASAGSRISGGDAFDVLVVGPNASAANAPVTSGRIDSATPLVRIVVRSAFYTQRDLKDAQQFQAGCRIAPVSALSERTGSLNVPSIRIEYDKFISRIEHMSANQFFSYFSDLVAAKRATSIVEPIREVLIAQEFSNAEPAVRSARARIRSYDHGSMRIGDWWAHFSSGPYGRDYLKRAAAVRSRFFNDFSQDYTQLVTDVDSAGDPLDGRFRYRLLFNRTNEPRARGPWFIGTRPLLRLGGSKMTRDIHGNICISIQRNEPAGVPQSHWLPTSAGPFKVVLHVFWPAEAILDGRWIPPPVELVT